MSKVPFVLKVGFITVDPWSFTKISPRSFTFRIFKIGAEVVLHFHIWRDIKTLDSCNEMEADKKSHRNLLSSKYRHNCHAKNLCRQEMKKMRNMLYLWSFLQLILPASPFTKLFSSLVLVSACGDEGEEAGCTLEHEKLPRAGDPASYWIYFNPFYSESENLNWKMNQKNKFSGPTFLFGDPKFTFLGFCEDH